MPPKLKPEDGWISGEQFKIPRQELAPAEVEGYLTWQFSDLAKKPKPLTLRETASVVRYMLWLAMEGVPKKVNELGPEAIHEYQVGRRNDEEIRARQDVELLAKGIWSDLLTLGQFETASTSKAQRFLRQHSSYWHDPWFASALRFFEDFELPTGAKPPIGPQRLVGRHLVVDPANPYLEDDLSERIAAASYALRRAAIRGRRALIAKALNLSPLTRRYPGYWGQQEVRDRVKVYEKQEHHLPADALADISISTYRRAMM